MFTLSPMPGHFAPLRALLNRLGATRWLRLALLVGLAALAIAAMLTLPPIRKGDGCEYAQMSESFANHLTPDARPEDIRALVRWCPGLQIEEEIPYFRGRDGGLYSWHFWGYSLTVVPVKLFLRVIGDDDLKALQVTNALLFVAALACVLFLAAIAPMQRIVWGLFTALPPAAWFIQWPHPEFFSYCLVTMSLVFAGRAAWGRAIVFAALASWQAPPLVCLVGFLCVRAMVAGASTTAAGVEVRVSTASALALAPLFFNLVTFGTPSLLARQASSVRNISAHRVLELLLDPNIGMAPYIPLAFALFLALVGRDLLMRRRLSLAVQLFGIMIVMMTVASSTTNWNSDTAGPSRYVVWMLPLVFFTVASEPLAWPPRGVWGGVYQGALALAMAGQILILNQAEGFFISRFDWLEHTPLAAFVLETAPAWYNPTPELFLERTLHQEPVVEPFAIFRSEGKCRKALIRWRDRPRIESECGTVPISTRNAPGSASVGQLFSGAKGKDRLIYVDFAR